MSLLVVEGLDGSGKSTQVALLARALAQRGPMRKISFPDYDSPSSALVKMYLAGEFGSAGEVDPYAAGAFYAVDRYASFQKDWQADYRQGTLVLADRYATSNLLYQMGKLPEAQWLDYAAWVEDFEYGKLGLPRPDRVILLDQTILKQGSVREVYRSREFREVFGETVLPADRIRQADGKHRSFTDG